MSPCRRPSRAGAAGAGRRRKGHNLALRMRDHRDDVLRFSRDGSVPPTNNAAERLVRPGQGAAEDLREFPEPVGSRGERGPADRG